MSADFVPGLAHFQDRDLVHGFDNNPGFDTAWIGDGSAEARRASSEYGSTGSEAADWGMSRHRDIPAPRAPAVSAGSSAPLEAGL